MSPELGSLCSFFFSREEHSEKWSATELPSVSVIPRCRHHSLLRFLTSANNMQKVSSSRGLFGLSNLGDVE